MPFIPVGKENSASIDLYYEDYGTGKPVVLVHPWPLSTVFWEKQVPVLVEAGYRVIAYDRRGFGKSSRPYSGYNFDTLTGDLQTLFETLDLTDAALVGCSMGGGEVARYAARDGGKRVRKIVFVSGLTPSLVKSEDNPQGFGEDFFNGLSQACKSDRAALLANYCQLFYGAEKLKGERVSEAALEAGLQVMNTASPYAAHACIEAWKEDFREDLRKIQAPALVVHGLADQSTPFALTGQRMPDFLKDVKLVTVDEAPHALAWTHAEVFNKELLDFLP